MSCVQSENKKIVVEDWSMWMDVQVLLPRDGEEVWACIHTSCFDQDEYQQDICKFYHSSGWTSRRWSPTSFSVHYWAPKPKVPPKPKWYIESLNDG